MALVLLVLWALPYGPLFPWSPLKPGYDHLTLARADIYWPKGSALDPAYRKVDQYIAQTEQYHGFAIRDRITIVACANWNEFGRYLPWIGRSVGAVTLDTGTAIYVTPKLAERKLDTGEFLLHELSHACLHQQGPLWRSVKMNKWGWLFEGIAVSNGQQKAFLSADEFAARAQFTDLTRVIGPKLDDLRQPLDMRFNYVAWRSFLEHMRKTRGPERFHAFLERFLDAPDDVHAEFTQVFGLSVADAVREFQNEVRAGRWHEETR